MSAKNYMKPVILITPLEGEVVLSTSVFEYDHITQPDDSWSMPRPKDSWTNWF